MATTGYSDTFGRTVAGGLGTATSGQPYTLINTAAQFSVAPNVATIAPNAAGNWAGYVDRQTSDIDITAQVALTAIPASNLATVGFVAKVNPTSGNYYIGTLMVATGGAMSLRFSKVISGGLSTIATVATGLTYVANTFYNLRFSAVWSNLLNTHVLSLKVWTLSAVQPGGWMATTTDGGMSQYTAGTGAGIFGRDESSVSGAVAAKIQNVAAMTYSLPEPAATDPMCADPAVVFPKQPALQSLASAVDAVMQTFDPLVSLAGAFPRVRVSATSATILNSSHRLAFTTTEFNIGTSTNLGYDSASLYLPVGIWLVALEIQLLEAAADDIQIEPISSGSPIGSRVLGLMRSSPVQSNDQGVGGTCHFTTLAYSTDPTVALPITPSFSSGLGANYTASYMALSAVKISDYFS